VLAGHGDMSITLCRQICRGLTIQFAAVSNGKDCQCFTDDSGFELALVPLVNCNTPCSGHTTQICGSAEFMNVFDVSEYKN